MSEVVELDKFRPHYSGPAKCMSCKHEWQAVVPVFTTDGLECPSCELFKGTFIGLHIPSEGQTFWQCNCGNDRFMVFPEGIYCELCDKLHDRDCGL